MKIGYARVSTQDQKLELQLDDLKSYGCETVYKGKVSGKSKSRPQLEKMIDQLRSGDVVVVWKLDRLGRSLRDLIDLVSAFTKRMSTLFTKALTFSASSLMSLILPASETMPLAFGPNSCTVSSTSSAMAEA